MRETRLEGGEGNLNKGGNQLNAFEEEGGLDKVWLKPNSAAIKRIASELNTASELSTHADASVKTLIGVDGCHSHRVGRAARKARSEGEVWARCNKLGKSAIYSAEKVTER